MGKIEIEEKNVEAAYEVADENGRKLLDALFGRREEDKKPSLDDYRSIKTYEDACEVLYVEPFSSANKKILVEKDGHGHEVFREELPEHIEALMKLETISRALWGRNWEPHPDADDSETYYYPLFTLYNIEEIEGMSDERKGAILFGYATNGKFVGFGLLLLHGLSSSSNARFGFRLCQENEEKAEYFGNQFIGLWAEYLAYNFEIKKRQQLK